VSLTWSFPADERSLQLSQIGLRLIDDLTGKDPIGEIGCALSVEDVPGQWRKTDITPVRSESGILTFPGLGRVRDVSGQPVRHYRAEISARYYRPFYNAPQTGIEFDIHPFNDGHPPPLPPALRDVALMPATNYPFQTHLRVLRGQVRNAFGAVVDAEVSRSNTERVLSDELGFYALPLRFTPNNTPVAIDATNHVTSEQGQIVITLPADLGQNKVITIV
jgi:hypothetical protein